jgi:methanethiol S-methyltransferase
VLNTGFLIILIACGLYGVIHSILASTTVKTLAKQRWGQISYRRFYRLSFVFIAFVTTLPLFVLVPLLPDQIIYRIPTAWLPLTLVIQAFAGLALLAGVLQTGAMVFLGIQQFIETGNPDHTPASDKLVVSGLYRWVRHPLYTASFFLLWLTPIMSWNLLALNLGLSIYMLVGTIFEEQKLVRQFGQEYLNYRRRTPRIIPGLKIT